LFFVLFLLLFFFFSFGLFVVILLFCDKHYVSHRLHTKLINATSHCRHHEKSRSEHLFHPFLNQFYRKWKYNVIKRFAYICFDSVFFFYEVNGKY
jgi:hypothetical protein